MSDSFVVADLQRDLDHDLDELYCLLKHGDIMINYYSTVSLEAAICGLPAIHVGNDGYLCGYRCSSSTSFEPRQTHNLRPFRLAAAKVARDERELLKYLDLYLGDPSIDRDARYEYTACECEYLDGKSSQRLAALIRDHIPS